MKQAGSFLLEMRGSSRARVAAARRALPLERLRERALATARAPPLALHPDGFDLIAEIKHRSPSRGKLAPGAFSVAGRALGYAAAGAAAVSVLTEPSRFGGELAHLASAALALAPAQVPVLRKDFLVDPYQVYEARAAGAGGVLVIVGLVDEEELAHLLEAAEETGLFVLLESFDADELGRARRLRAEVPLLLGLNCRDLTTLEVDLDRLERLRPELPEGVPIVAESGVRDPRDAGWVARLGYSLALVGSALMLHADPPALVDAMLAAGRAARRERCAYA